MDERDELLQAVEALHDALAWVDAAQGDWIQRWAEAELERCRALVMALGQNGVRIDWSVLRPESS